MSAKIWIENEKLYIVHPFDLSLNEKYRQMYFIWNPKEKRREKKVSKIDQRSAHFLKNHLLTKKYNWQIDPKVSALILDKLGEEDRVGKGFGEIEKIPEFKVSDMDFSSLKIPPFHYQKEVISFMNSAKGIVLLGCEMGTGKTGMVIAYASISGISQTLIVCPASLKYKWKDEVAKFTDKTAQVLSDFEVNDLNPKIKLADFVIINYEQLSKYESYLSKAKFECVALDESHYLQNLQSQRTKIVFKLFKKTPKRICISGTPIRNRPIDFYAQLKFLRPDIFGNKLDYGIRYCNAKETPFGIDYKGASNLEELNRRISSFYVRKTKREVLKDLPKKTVSLIELEMNQSQKKDYLLEENDFFEMLSKKDTPISNNDLGKMVKMRQVCSRHKVEAIVEFVERFLESSEDRKIVIFAQFVETQKILRDKFKNVGVSLLGSDNAEKRHEAVSQFQNNPDKRVFVGSSIAASTGLDLYVADTVLFADLMWVPSDHQQCEDRCHRVGQINPVSVYYFIFKDTIESMIWSVVGKKLSIINEVLDKNMAENTFHAEKVIFNQFLNKFKDKK